ncbi:MAG TPA: hypothetical protein VMV53_00805 [Acidimicrobiales bacterium]|nr:hypothetical protein [Acidimicrobiales bacterium]
MEIALVSIAFALLALAVAVVPLIIATRMQAKVDASTEALKFAVTSETTEDVRVPELVS